MSLWLWQNPIGSIKSVVGFHVSLNKHWVRMYPFHILHHIWAMCPCITSENPSCSLQMSGPSEEGFFPLEKDRLRRGPTSGSSETCQVAFLTGNMRCVSVLEEKKNVPTCTAVRTWGDKETERSLISWRSVLIAWDFRKQWPSAGSRSVGKMCLFSWSQASANQAFILCWFQCSLAMHR